MLLLPADLAAAPQLAKLHHPYDLALAPLLKDLAHMDLRFNEVAGAALEGALRDPPLLFLKPGDALLRPAMHCPSCQRAVDHRSSCAC